MKLNDSHQIDIKLMIKLALMEDMPEGDITTSALTSKFIKPHVGNAKLVAKSNLTLSGISVFEMVFKTVNPSTKLKWNFKDGNKVKKGQTVCEIQGNLDSLLKAERTALNFLGRLSGIATLTSQFVAETKNTKTKIIDTRKTAPLYRSLEKKAVQDGGGFNHRMNLSDAYLIKENHIRMAGSISSAIISCRKKNPKMKIEVEVMNLSEIREALAANADRVMLDNMSLELMKEAVALIKNKKKKCEIEASGNMTLKRIKKVAALGVDFISVGQITHSAPVADLSLLFERETKGKNK